MEKKLIFCAALLLLATACSKERDLYDSAALEEKQQAEERDHAEKQLGIVFDQKQTWMMSQVRELQITQLPTDINTTSVMILSANPFLSNTANVLSYSDKPVNKMYYEAPQDCSTLYVACIDADGDARVRAFDVATSTVDFSVKTQGYQIEEAAASRRMAPRKTASLNELQWQPTFNAKTFASTGWADEWAYVEQGDAKINFTDFTRYKNIALTYLPEGKLNYRDIVSKNSAIRDCFYTVDKNGGEVTVTPIWSDTGNPTPRFGYYYFEPGADQNIKTVRKFIFEAPVPMNYHNKKDSEIPSEQTILSYKLIYYDAEGNPSYNFPEGTRIGFFNTVNPRYISAINEPFNWYNIGDANLELSTYFREKNVGEASLGWSVGWETYSHTVMFQRDGENFIAFGDWIKDFDMNDIILLLNGDVEDLPVAGLETPKNQVFTYAFEDTRNGDYDMNDVVLRVCRNASNKLTVELAAVGASDEIKVYYHDPITKQDVPLFNGQEVHAAFREKTGVQSTFYNTLEANATSYPTSVVTIDDRTFTYAKADFFIKNVTKGIDVHTPASQGITGCAPYAICVPTEWAWPVEYQAITGAYSTFKGFASNLSSNLDWYNFPVSNKVFVAE